MPKKQIKIRKTLPKDIFFEKIEKLGEALTFDDVRLKSGYSEVMLKGKSGQARFPTPHILSVNRACPDFISIRFPFPL